MADIAELGFKADTGQLETAVTTLNSLSPAAAKAEKSSNSLKNAINGLDSTASALTTAINGLNSKITAMVSGSNAEANAVNAVATATTKKTAATKASTQATKDATVAANAAAAAYKKQALAAAFPTSISRLAPSSAFNAATGVQQNANSNGQKTSTFNTANIAAQFHDVGVTAAMGMNPLQIALQQGTQLSQVLNTMEKPLEGIAQGFKEIINPISLMTIGFIAALAVLIQLVPWLKVGEAALRGLADAIRVTGPYVLAFAAILALIYGPEIIEGIASVGISILELAETALTAGVEMAAAWIIGLGPIGLIIAGVGVLLIAINLFRDQLKKIFGTDLVADVKAVVNFIIGAFIGMEQVIIQIWKNIGAVMRREPTTALTDVFKDALAKDYVGQFANGVVTGMNKAADGLDKLSASLGTSKKAIKDWAEVLNGAQRSLATLQAENAELGLSAEASAKLKYETQLLNQAKEKNLTLSAAQRGQLLGIADAMGVLDAATKQEKDTFDFLKDTTKGFFTDLKQGLQDGKTMWESFRDAVLNVISKIQDKLLDMAVNNLFDKIGPGVASGIKSGSASGGSAGGLFSGLGSLFSSGLKSLGGALGFNAKGNSFGNGTSLAQGVYTQPTVFKYAKGDAFGVMAEAGAEAVMPLRRGPDGSLGVQMYNQNSAGSNSGPSAQTNNHNGYVFNVGTNVNQQDLLLLRNMVLATAGPGVVEQRVRKAQARGSI